MITDHSNGRLDEIKSFATTNGLTDGFKKTFTRLERHTQEGNDVKLYTDFAPLSLYFEIFREGRVILNGGMIFHGKHDGFGSGSAPTFSVSIDPERSPHWEIHT